MKVIRMLANGAMVAAAPLSFMALGAMPLSAALAASSSQHGSSHSGPSHHGSSDPGSGVNGSSGIMGQTPEPPTATAAPRRPMPTPRTDAEPGNRPQSGSTMTNPSGNANGANPATTPRDTPAPAPSR